MDLAEEHGIEGNQIAICPPKGSYQNILTDFNRLVAAVPGMENALWFLTRVPSEQDAQDAQSIGMAKPSWWHNWTRPHSGFTHLSSSCLFREDTKKRSYMNVPSMAEGWHSPDYETLAANGEFILASMPWGGNSWPQYYIVPVISWWGWNPEGHDWEAVRGRIYDIVFGPAQVELAREFDDALIEVESLFTYSPDWPSEWLPCCPARLKDTRERGKALDLFEKLQKILGDLEKRAPDETLLSQEQLSTEYLEPMRSEIERGATMARLPYPEYWWISHQTALLEAIYDGRLEDAAERIESVQANLLKDIDEISQALQDLRIVDNYREWWEGRARMSVQDWQDLISRRQEELQDWVWDYGYYMCKTSTMLGGVDSPPLGWGTGRWEHANRLIATAIPGEREYFWGEWMGGVYEATPAIAFAHKRKRGAPAGSFSEIDLRLPVSGDRDRLALMIYLSTHSKHTIGSDFVRSRWGGRIFVELLWEERVLWEEDIGVIREQGEWFVVHLRGLPPELEELPLRLRVENRRVCGSSTIAFVGPILLVELGD
jgi:hypothetical protein